MAKKPETKIVKSEDLQPGWKADEEQAYNEAAEGTPRPPQLSIEGVAAKLSLPAQMLEGGSPNFTEHPQPTAAPPVELQYDPRTVAFKGTKSTQQMLVELNEGGIRKIPAVIIPYFDVLPAPKGYVGRHVEVRLSDRQASALARFTEALNLNNQRIENGRHVGESKSFAIKWLLDRLADSYDEADANAA